MLIYEIEKPKISDFFAGFNFYKKIENLRDLELIGSGKGGIALILKYLSEKNIIKKKTDEILVPDWIGYWVYNQIQSFAFPTKKLSDRTKVIFVYHQYGFPQDMDKIMEIARDKKLIVVEDCAHAINSFYKGKRLGTFGDFSIYSFSKWFSCFALGGVKSNFPDFKFFVKKEISRTPIGLTWFKDLSKFFFERSRFSTNEIYKKYANFLLGASYALYGHSFKGSRLAQILLAKKLDKEIEIRNKRYKHFLEKVKSFNVCGHLESEGITPYVIPIKVPEEKTDELIKVMRNFGVITGRYNFDINRNIFNPNFIQTVLVPCHGGITDETFYSIIDLIINILSKR